MELLKKLLEDARHLLFLDFEGTQYSHEVIAVGAVLVDCDENYIPTGEPSSFKCYVKANDRVGPLVSTMTGISDSLLEKEGVDFSTALTDLNLFLANRSPKLKVLTYGNQDKKMLLTSFSKLANPSKFQTDFVNYLSRNTIDIGTFISRFLRGKKNEFISLIHLRDFLKLEPSGQAHDPLVDSLDLYHIYQVLVSRKEILIGAYKNLLKTSSLVPSPIRKLVCDLIDGKDIKASDLDLALEIYFA